MAVGEIQARNYEDGQKCEHGEKERWFKETFRKGSHLGAPIPHGGWVKKKINLNLPGFNIKSPAS